jgi:NADH dehydrogenase (ubiquinone) Fe-S protein 3
MIPLNFFFLTFFFNFRQIFLLFNFFFFFLSFNKFLITIRISDNGFELFSFRKFSYLLLILLKSSIFFQVVYLLDIIILDFYTKKLRFQLTYVLRSLKYNCFFKLNFFTTELIPIISVSNLFPCSNWLEREIWDLFGIYFFFHKDLRRLLTDYSFQQFPFRKDFPLTGFFDIFYSDKKKKITVMPISLVQEYRFFDLKHVW